MTTNRFVTLRHKSPTYTCYVIKDDSEEEINEFKKWLLEKSFVKDYIASIETIISEKESMETKKTTVAKTLRIVLPLACAEYVDIPLVNCPVYVDIANGPISILEADEVNKNYIIESIK
jgi:hypothetical protein